MSYTVLVCDDEPGIARDWADRVRSVASASYEVRPTPDIKVLAKGVRELFARRAAIRDLCNRDNIQCLFDEVDILILDYDLLHVDQSGARLTGEGLARLARAYSRCGILVVLNQYSGVHFDLGLRGHLSSYADLNIDADLLECPGLWHKLPVGGFRPWSWQDLGSAVDTHSERVAAVRRDLDTAFVEFLGIEREDAWRLSDSAFAFVAPDADDFDALREKSVRSLLPLLLEQRDAQALIENAEANADAISSVLAARIGKWLEHEVLGPQDVLVDVPHLIQRFPFLLGDNVSDIGAWNDAIHQSDALRHEIPSQYWFEPEGLLSRPAVWWSRLENDEAIRDRRSDFDFSKVPDLVFLEDESVFAPISDAREFRSGHHNQFSRRYARVIDGWNYAPQRRLAFG